MPSKYQRILNKIKTKPSLEKQITIWKKEGKTITFTNGCFDILHRGHAEYLAKAAEFSDLLIVGLNADASVTRLKGKNRPIVNQEERAILLASLEVIDAVIIFEEDTPYNMIQLILPNCLVKGADYKPEDIIGYDIVAKNGGKIKTIELSPGCSTTNIIEKVNHL